MLSFTVFHVPSNNTAILFFVEATPSGGIFTIAMYQGCREVLTLPIWAKSHGAEQDIIYLLVRRPSMLLAASSQTFNNLRSTMR